MAVVVAKRIVLAMSGGVDSSVAAHLLQKEGYEIVGLFMRSGVHEEVACATGSSALPVISSNKQGCCSASDAADARRVADSLDIPFHAVNFQDAFGRIKDYFADEYLAGRTPNPCVMCNNWLKFGKLWDYAQQVGAEGIATGHYAQLVERDGRPTLIRGIDDSKDQSYVLFGLDRELLSRIHFPVGSYNKTEIRDIAREVGCRLADKPDSHEICFVPDQDYAGFIRRYRGEHETSGEVVDTAGNVVGEHGGYEQFTIGQRKGLGIAFGSPRYVVSINAETKQVVVGEHDDLARHELQANRLNWLIDNPSRQFQCMAKIRYLHPPAKAEVEITGDDQMTIRFTDLQYGVAPGQAVVCYEGDHVLGGGWII